MGCDDRHRPASPLVYSSTPATPEGWGMNGSVTCVPWVPNGRLVGFSNPADGIGAGQAMSGLVGFSPTDLEAATAEDGGC
jgi:hypothetical protein